MNRRQIFHIAPALLVGLLVACAPAPAERVSVTQAQVAASYYPHGAGAFWRYLAEGEPEDAPPLYQRVEGPTIIGGERLTAWQTSGRGVETRTFRDYREDGVYIVRETGPGYVTGLEPAIKEWPREGALSVGLSWGGETTATITFTDAARTDTLRLEYRYTVVDQRTIETAAGRFEVYVVAFESQSFDEAGAVQETLQQELWYAPFVGEVKTEGDLFLVQSNLLGATQTGAAPSSEQ